MNKGWLSSRPMWAATVCLLALAAVGAWWVLRPAPRPAVEKPVVLVVSGDTGGWIVPCGCTANQSGGLLRRGTFIRPLHEHSFVIYADAGGAAGGTSAYQRSKFEAILKGEMLMGVAAHNLGGPEAALGADYLRRVASELKAPFISANLRDGEGRLVAEPVRVIDQGLRRWAIAGVLSRRFAASGLQVDDPREALLTAIAGVKVPYESLVVLAYLPEEELQQLAASLPEADVVIGGPTGQSIAPKPVGQGLLASATNKGKFLIQLEKKSPAARWSGEVVEMGPKLADDAEQQANLSAFLAELGRRDFTAGESGLATPLPAGLPEDYRLAGNSSCTRCHKEDCRSWEGSKHAHAWKTLEARGQHVDSYCQQCHTNGYGLPGGFESMRGSIAAVNVGCESCHGPSLGHNRDPKVKTAFAPRDQCTRCHDRENSPKFDHAGYWLRIRHGSRTK
jgi:hypothetical protein